MNNQSPANLNRFSPHSSQYRSELSAFARKIVEIIDSQDSNINTYKTIWNLLTPLVDILDHEFSYGIGLGAALDDWLEYLVDGNAQMATHQRKIVVDDLEKFLSTTPEQYDEYRSQQSV